MPEGNIKENEAKALRPSPEGKMGQLEKNSSPDRFDFTDGQKRQKNSGVCGETAMWKREDITALKGSNVSAC